jgi:hypothetical protein
MKRLLVLLFVLITLAYAATLEQDARVTATTLGGLLGPAQAAHKECATDARKAECRMLSRAIIRQNALVYALATYCGWSTTAPLPDRQTACKVVPKAAPELKSATANANQVISQVKRLQ